MKLIQSVNPVEIYDNLQRDYINYLCTAFHIKDPGLETAFLENVHNYSFINGPILEATPPFKSGCLLQALADEGVLNQKTVDIFIDVLPFLKESPLYLHQERAIRKLSGERNIIVSSGTN